MKKNKQKKPYTFEIRQKCVKITLLTFAVLFGIACFFAPLWVTIVSAIDLFTLLWAIKKPLKEETYEEISYTD